MATEDTGSDVARRRRRWWRRRRRLRRQVTPRWRRRRVPGRRRRGRGRRRCGLQRCGRLRTAGLRRAWRAELGGADRQDGGVTSSGAGATRHRPGRGDVSVRPTKSPPWGFPAPGVEIAGGGALALAVPCSVPRDVAVVAARREGALRVDVVAGEAVEAFANKLGRHWPWAVRALLRTTTPTPPALDKSVAVRVHGRAHPGDV